jgi:hypothetical protein
MSSLKQRLEALKATGVIDGFFEPHRNEGLAKGLTPWVIVPAGSLNSTTYATEARCQTAVEALEMFGPMQLTGR